MHTHTLLLWTGFGLSILLVLALDLGVLHRKAHSVTLREAALWCALWLVLALLFAAGVCYHRGSADGMQFLTGYLIELSLSADNVFLFAVLFAHLQVPAQYQHRVLTWGVLSAIAMRGLLIASGSALIHRFHWIIYLFGGFLILVGLRMFLHRNRQPDLHNNRLLLWLQRHVPLSPDYDGQKFFTRLGARQLATPLFCVLVLIEITDLLFALDSIPAIFAITRDPFLVFTSNIFAILGLRSLYFLLAGAMKRFCYLTVGLSVILIFIGFKMLGVVEIPTFGALLVVVALLAAAILASLLKTRCDRRAVPTPLPQGKTEN